MSRFEWVMVEWVIPLLIIIAGIAVLLYVGGAI